MAASNKLVTSSDNNRATKFNLQPNGQQIPNGSKRLGPSLYRSLKFCARGIRGQLRLCDSYRFEDRSDQNAELVCLVAGRKRELWHLVLPHIEEAAADRYVCVVSPGIYDKALSLLCEQWGWSYLSTATKDANLAQNICYSLHEDAEIIVKIDEDMFLLPGSIEALVDRYQSIRNEGIVRPGVLAPLVPIDGHCYRYFLEALNLLDGFELLFGKARMHAQDSAVVTSSEAALWIWQQTSPLSYAAEALAELPEKLLYVPIVLNTGMIVFERSFWEAVGYLPVYRRRLVFGKNTNITDSEYICSRAMMLSRPVIMTSHVVAGRFSHEAQYKDMREQLGRNPGMFAI